MCNENMVVGWFSVNGRKVGRAVFRAMYAEDKWVAVHLEFGAGDAAYKEVLAKVSSMERKRSNPITRRVTGMKLGEQYFIYVHGNKWAATAGTVTRDDAKSIGDELRNYVGELEFVDLQEFFVPAR